MMIIPNNSALPGHSSQMINNFAINSNIPPQNASVTANNSPWIITPLEHQSNDGQFVILHPIGVPPMIGGDQARPFFLKSGLPATILAQIWQLADLNKDGKLDRFEFSVAMKLVRNCLAGIPLPPTLPDSMRQIIGLTPSMSMGQFNGGAPTLSGPITQPQMPPRPMSAYGTMPAINSSYRPSYGGSYSAAQTPTLSGGGSLPFQMGTNELGDWTLPQPVKLRFCQQFNQFQLQALDERSQQLNTEQQNSRRFEESYKTALCKNWLAKGECDYGRACHFAHGSEDIRPSRNPPPINSKYKTRACKEHAKRGICPYGHQCLFIHPADQQPTSLISLNFPAPLHQNSNTNASLQHNRLSQSTLVGIATNAAEGLNTAAPPPLGISSGVVSTGHIQSQQQQYRQNMNQVPNIHQQTMQPPHGFPPGTHINPQVYPGYAQGTVGVYGGLTENGAMISEAEFQEIMNRNQTVSSSAIHRAASDAASGDYTSAIETLVTAISHMRQSRVARDDRCKLLINTLQDTLNGMEAKFNSSGSRKHRRERSRSPIRTSKRHRRSHSRSRSRDRSGYDYSPIRHSMTRRY